MRILIRQLQNPHAEGVLACPTYLDFVHAYDRGSSTFVTDNLYETLNDFEIWVEDKINTAIEAEFRDSISRQVLTIEQQDKLKVVVLSLVRNSYSGPINLNKLMDPRNYEPIPEDATKKKDYKYVGPFKFNTSQKGPYSAPLPSSDKGNDS